MKKDSTSVMRVLIYLTLCSAIYVGFAISRVKTQLSMWKSEPLTTDAHRRTIIKGIKALNLVGLTPSYPSLERFKKGTRSDLSLLSKPGCDL